jgi:hypothetical protein
MKSQNSILIQNTIKITKLTENHDIIDILINIQE